MHISNPKSTESALMPLLQDARTITFIKTMVPITPSDQVGPSSGQCLLAKHFKLVQLIGWEAGWAKSSHITVEVSMFSTYIDTNLASFFGRNTQTKLQSWGRAPAGAATIHTHQ